MKKLFLGSVALVALGLAAPAAFAADRGVPAYAPPPPPAPAYTWSGCYVGANAGNSSGRSTHSTVANSVLTAGGLGVPAVGGPRRGSNSPGSGWIQHRRRPQPLRLHRRLPRRLQLSGRHVGHWLRRRRPGEQQGRPEFRGGAWCPSSATAGPT